jgi:putative phosphoribosyl transferase
VVESLETTKFRDRREAGRLLTQKLLKYRGAGIVYALPRGGVETAVEVASELKLPLRLVIARKIGHPADSEYAIGAVTETGPAIWDEAQIARISEWWTDKAERQAKKEIKRRSEVYDIGQAKLSVKGKTAIVIDDGIATGLTMLAAVDELRLKGPGKVIVATPVVSQDGVDALKESSDELVMLIGPSKAKDAVGLHYDKFPQLNDNDVLGLLSEAESAVAF